MEDGASRLQTTDHDEAVLVAVQPSEEGDPGLVVVRGRRKDVPRQGQRRRHLAAIAFNVIGIQRAQCGRSSRRNRGEGTEQGFGVMITITLNEFGIVVVVSGVEPDARGQGRAQLLLMISGEQRDLHSVDLGALIVDQIQECAGRGRNVERTPVTA